jgi:diguanylate cyclase (GGDEF)-like protein
MPTVMVSHVVLDVPTLFAVTLFITVIGGLLLLFAFLQNRNTPALALWGIGYLVGAAGAALLSGQAAAIPNVWAVGAANALLCTAYGFMWCGARSFEGRRVSLIGLAIGPVLWIELEQRLAAETDLLTGVPNRRAFFDRGNPLLEHFIAERQPAALLLFDLDRFKDINDTAGHQAGDQVLRAFCDLVGTSVRPGDLFGRLGGEEFAYLMANVSVTQALQTAERLRLQFAALQFADLAITPTVSVGVAMASEAGRNLSALLALADRALYRAKADGRNRVAPAPFIRLEAKGGEAVRRQVDRPPSVATPVAG